MPICAKGVNTTAMAYNAHLPHEILVYPPKIYLPTLINGELKIRRRRNSATADLVEGVWGEVAVAMARKIALRKLARRRVVVTPFPDEV